MTTSEVEGMLETVKEEGKLPANVTGKTYDAMVESLTKYFNKASADQVTNFADKAAEICEQALKTEQQLRPQGGTATVGMGTADSRMALSDFVEDAGESLIGKSVDFFLRVAQEVANGAGNYMAQNWDQDRVDAFPALEFHRVYPRDVPRGSEEDKAGPENAWDDDDGRWPAACEEAGDDDALDVFNETGRCVALKSSGVWEALGDGAGGYDDTLGNPFAPFAFNSGWDTDEVSRAEAVELGLMDEDDEVEPAKIDFADLIGLDFRRSVQAAEAGHPFYGNQYTDAEGKVQRVTAEHRRRIKENTDIVAYNWLRNTEKMLKDQKEHGDTPSALPLSKFNTHNLQEYAGEKHKLLPTPLWESHVRPAAVREATNRIRTFPDQYPHIIEHFGKGRGQ